MEKLKTYYIIKLQLCCGTKSSADRLLHYFLTYKIYFTSTGLGSENLSGFGTMSAAK